MRRTDANGLISERFQGLTIDRRRFLKKAGLLSLSIPVFGALLSACADDDDETAPVDEPSEDADDEDVDVDDTEATDDDNGEESADGGTMLVAWEAEPWPLDPTGTTAASVMRATRLIYQTLILPDLTQSADDVPAPPLVEGLAESWEVDEDATEFTFSIRQGVEFHDGTPLDANAFVFNWDRALNEDFEHYSGQAASFLNSTLRWVESYEAEDDMTFTVQLSEPFASFLLHMSNEAFGVISPAAIEEHGEDIGSNPVGTGPFRYVDRVAGDRIDLERNEDYWDDNARLEGIVIRPISESASRVAALQGGEVDFVVTIPPDSVQMLEDEPDIEVVFAGPPHVWFWMLNFRDTPTQDKLVRQAMNYAIDRESLVNDILSGTAEPAAGPVPPGNPAYNPDVTGYEYDPERALALLEEAGYGDGFELAGFVPDSGSGMMVPMDMNEFIQSNLADVGISVTFDVMEFGAFIERGGQGLQEEDGFLQTSWGSNDMFWVEEMFHSALHPPNGNVRTWYDNPEVDELLEQARGEADEELRVSLYQQAEELIIEDATWLFVCHDRAPKAYHNSVQGFVGAPSWHFDMINMRLDQS